MTASYNKRPVKKTVYKNGKKQSLAVRVLKGIFPIKGDSAFEIVRKLIFIGAFGTFLFYGSDVVFKTVNEFRSDMTTRALLKQINSQVNLDDPDIQQILKEKPTMLPEFLNLYNANNDFIGHIQIGNETNGNIIDYPVYQGEDNEYYLKHTPEHKFSDGGSIFADYRNKFTPEGISANTLLYGHNFMLGTYFTLLSRYYTGEDKNRFTADDLEFYQKYPTIRFDTLYERSEWKIFACLFVNVYEEYGEVLDYANKINFPDENSFNEFILEVMDMSVFFTDVDITYGDNILTLSTCYFPFGGDFTRCVVFARKVRDGESPEVNTNKAVLNTAEFRWLTQRNRIGTNWNGRIWDAEKYLLSYNP